MNVCVDSVGVGLSHGCLSGTSSLSPCLVFPQSGSAELSAPCGGWKTTTSPEPGTACRAGWRGPAARSQASGASTARDPVRLDDERLDQQRQADRDRDRHDQLDCRVKRSLRPVLFDAASSGQPGRRRRPGRSSRPRAPSESPAAASAPLAGSRRVLSGGRVRGGTRGLSERPRVRGDLRVLSDALRGSLDGLASSGSATAAAWSNSRWTTSSAPP